ncbi:hypothetical protein EW146_g1655 [Bondarzewia mesenterica]|uniref:N-acetyltransferase domain-containing protein n=1 Tax=Bondarzewia mesenterica TaxID=1095465 RepID=A0A4S4M363_9AGAM|nr:hypothetical protein EW146_g1655 [Bondarzewia mesenterica]
MSANSKSVSVRRLQSITDDELSRSTAALYAAFSEARFMNILVGGDKSLLPLYQAASIKSCVIGGHFFVAGLGHDDITGVATWYAPGETSFGTMVICLITQLTPTYDKFLNELLGAEYRKSAWYLQLMGVTPETQNHGIATALMEAAEYLARKSNSPMYLETTSENAVSFYKRLGFVIRGSSTVSHPMGDTTAYVMSKDVPKVAELFKGIQAIPSVKLSVDHLLYQDEILVLHLSLSYSYKFLHIHSGALTLKIRPFRHQLDRSSDGSREYAKLLTPLQRILHSVFSSRILLHLRRAVNQNIVQVSDMPAGLPAMGENAVETQHGDGIDMDLLSAATWSPYLLFCIKRIRSKLLPRIFLCILVVPSVGFLRTQYAKYVNKKAAAALGAVPIPCVRGKWPGNLDLHRSIARPWAMVRQNRLSDLNIYDQHAATTINFISSFAGDSIAFDAQDLFARFTLNSASEFLFGNCLNTLHGKLPVAGRAKLGPKGSSIEDEFGTFAWAFEDIQVQIARRTRIGKPWPLFELFKDKTAKSNAIVRNWLKPLVESALREKVSATYLLSTDDAEAIRFQILNMLLAGRDTTTLVLSFVIYFLCLHPDVMRRLREEILREEILQEYGEDGQPSIQTMKNMQYLRAVIDETLRLFPPVPMNLRLSDSAPHAFPAIGKSPKYHIPPGTVVVYHTLLLQRRPDIWGEDADDFNPDRWLDPEYAKRVTENPFIFIPFHAGPRLCLGQNFAYNEMTFFLVKLLQKFRGFELAPTLNRQNPFPLRGGSKAKVGNPSRGYGPRVL